MNDPRSAPGVTASPQGNEVRGRGARVDYVEVEKLYGSTRALHPITFSVSSGEFFSMIGPSGSGKTTLLATTAGFIPPTGGNIFLDGDNVVGIPPFKRNIGMVFQNYSLFPHMTVAENIGFPLKMRRVAKSEIATRVKRMLDVVRLPTMGDRWPNQLSGGQQQRVALARAAVYDPLLLLMDEPLGALDKNLREEMQYEIKQFQAALGTTVIYVTHDQHEAASMSHRIGIVNLGRVEQIGTPRDLYEHPRNRFVASFLGEANMFEVVEATAGPSGGLIVRTEDGIMLRTTQGEAISERHSVCVRPEAVSLSREPNANADNQLSGTIYDVTYAAGTVRCRIRLSNGDLVIQRQPSERASVGYALGDVVHLSWSADDTLLVAD